MIWPLIFIPLIGGGLLEVVRVQRARLRSWRAAAAANGLKVVQASNLWASRSRLVAQADPITVRIEGSARGGTRIVVVVPEQPGFGEVRIRRFNLLRPEALDISIGDEAFDRTFTVEGPMRLLCVLLYAKTRRLLHDVNDKGPVEIGHGEIRAEMYDDELPDVLPLLLRLGRRFAERVDVVRCLANHAQRDPKSGVRLCNLLTLLHECAQGPLTAEVLHKACLDSSPQVRLHAAMALGAEGRDVLMELALHAKSDDCSAQAVRALGPELPLDRTQAILDGALRRDHVQTAHACLEVFGRYGTTEAVAALAHLIERDRGELAPAAAKALGITGNAAAEPPLIRALQHERMDVRVAAAKALGSVGSAAAVLPLKQASRYSYSPTLNQAARQAIAEIQSRLPGASPGQLSLAGAEAGQLSLAQTETGQLSLATDQAGEVSLAPGEPGQLSLSDGEERLKAGPGGTA